MSEATAAWGAGPGEMNLNRVMVVDGERDITFHRPLAVSARTKKRHSKRVVIGQSTFTLLAGKTQTVSVPLSATGKKLLKHFRNLPATLTISLLSTSLPIVVHTATTIKQNRSSVGPIIERRVKLVVQSGGRQHAGAFASTIGRS